MRQSAGLLCYRYPGATTAVEAVEVFLVHPGGPFWARKDARAWSIPKGEFTASEAPLAAARREFAEETGLDIERVAHGSEFVPLPPLRHGGKIIHAFAVAADFDATAVRSNMFTLEWPPRSGLVREFPEIDRADWFALAAASEKLHAGQAALPDALRALLKNNNGTTRSGT